MPEGEQKEWQIEMANGKDTNTSLIEEMEALEQLAASLQTGKPHREATSPPDQVTRLRELYLDWYARCMARLNKPGQDLFSSHYGSGYQNIHNYIAGPAEVRPIYANLRASLTYGGSNTRTIKSWSWTHPFDIAFKRPFNEQRMLLMRVRATLQAKASAPPPPPAIDTIRLHSRVKAVSEQLFKDGHNRQSILRACLALNEAVQQRSGRSDLDGTKLMQHVFSLGNPALKFDGHPDEQQGYMWLFSGMTMAIRNPRAHQVGEAEDLDANEALEMLALISALFRALDRATKV